MNSGPMVLTEFLLARIAEDERRLDVAGYAPHHHFGTDRLRAECEAKRAIASEHNPSATSLVATSDDGGSWRDVEPDSFEDIVSRDIQCMACRGYPPAPCRTLRLLVLPYAQHPDYLEEWKP